MTPKSIQKIIQEKVIGKIEPAHDLMGHHYRFAETGTIVDSVTTKITLEKPHLRKWYARLALEWMETRWPMITPENRKEMFETAALIGTQNRDDAGRIGTSGHEIIDNYLKAWLKNGKRPQDVREFMPPDVIDPRVYACIRSAERLFTKYNVIPVASELLVGDEELKIAGTLDFIAFFDGKLMMSDWKSSNQVSDEYAMQISAYAYLFQKMTGIKVDGCNLVKLSKQYDDFTLYNIPRPNEAFAAFRGQMKTYNWLKNSRKKLIEDKKIIKL